MTRLSVNINKNCTLRNARGGNNPNVVKVAQDCEAFGAQESPFTLAWMKGIFGMMITQLKKVVTTEFNIRRLPG